MLQGADSTKSEELNSRQPQLGVPLTEATTKRSDNGSCVQDKGSSNVSSNLKNSIQPTLTSTYSHSQDINSKGHLNSSVVYSFASKNLKNFEVAFAKAGCAQNKNFKTYPIAGNEKASDLNLSPNLYSRQYPPSSSVDFFGNTSNNNADLNSGSSNFFTSVSNVNLNQQYYLNSRRENSGSISEEPVNSTATSTGSYFNATYASADSTSNNKYLLKRIDSSNNKNKSDRNTEIGSAVEGRGSFVGDYATRWGTYYASTDNNQELNCTSVQTASKMSGGPPHHPHGRQAPSPNTAWNHLQVPNYYPRQPQHAHMSNEHPLLHQPTWHTPTTEPVKSMSHSHLFNLEQMISERPYPRHSPGVDLSLQRNGSQNGELPTTPISLSVRDANKINSLPASAIDIQAVELTKSLSPGLKSSSPGLKTVAPGIKPASPVLKSVLPQSPTIRTPISPGISTSPGMHEKQDSPKSLKRSAKRMDSIIERLNPIADKGEKIEKTTATSVISEKVSLSAAEEKQQPQSQAEKLLREQIDKPCQSSVIVQPSIATSSHDENSSSSSLVLNAPTPTNTRDDDVISPFSNEDSTDSSKSRRKRKPAKTVRVSKDTEKYLEIENQTTAIDSTKDLILEDENIESKTEENQKQRRRSGSAPPGSPTLPPKSRRKTSSESETIANIAAMVQNTAFTKSPTEANCLSNASIAKDKNIVESQKTENSSKPISVSVIKTKENANSGSHDQNEHSREVLSPAIMIQTPAQKKATETISFVEVENKLEEMFAGISDDVVEPPKMEKMSLDYNEDTKTLGLEESRNEDTLLKLEDDNVATTSQLNDSVTSTSTELSSNQNMHKRGRPKGSKSRRSSESTSLEVSPKRKKGNKKSKSSSDGTGGKTKVTSNKKSKGKNSITNKQILTKADIIKDVYAYDSGSNASSSKSRGPFVQIRGSRESPISVNIINTPTNDEDSDKKSHKSKKYHDDTEYRHKVRSRGLHCSTLSNKYDAQTRDATWICVFCKRGPHATDPNLSGPSRFNATITIPAPGDLFGPYIITTDSPEYQRRLDDPYDQQFKSKKVARAVGAVVNSKISSKKSKRKHSDSYDSRSSMEGGDNTDIYLGITETKDKVYEVWAHEDCIVWSPGVYLVGPKIIGLEEAVWTSCNVVCNKCQYRGANVCCVKRGCMSVMHLGCAAASEWYLDEENYKAICIIHKAP